MIHELRIVRFHKATKCADLEMREQELFQSSFALTVSGKNDGADGKGIVNLVYEGHFNPEDIDQLAKPIGFGNGQQIVLKLLIKIGLINCFMWDRQLKENQAYEKRFDCPYLFLTKRAQRINRK